MGKDGRILVDGRGIVELPPLKKEYLLKEKDGRGIYRLFSIFYE